MNETIDRIFEIGARVITAADAPIHASGHGYQEDMKLMLNLTRPKYVMPMHGDYKRLRLHAGLAESVGVEPDRIFQSRNGVPLEIDAKGARLGDDIGAGMIFVDGLELGEPDDAALRDRRTLSADGLVIVVATVSIEDGEVAADPEISFRGVPFRGEEDTERLLVELADVVEDKLEEALRGKTPRALADPPGRPRRGRQLRLQAPQAPPDGPAGGHRGVDNSDRILRLRRPRPVGSRQGLEAGSAVRELIDVVEISRPVAEVTTHRRPPAGRHSAAVIPLG